MTTIEAIIQWLDDNKYKYKYYHKIEPYQIRIEHPVYESGTLVIVSPGPDFDDHKVIVWQTRSNRYDTYLNIADPEFFKKFEMSLL